MPYAEGKIIGTGLPKEILVDEDGYVLTKSATTGTDSDLVFDYANAEYNAAVTDSVKLLDTPAECKYVQITTDLVIFVNEGPVAAAADDSVMIPAGVPTIIPATPGGDIYGFAEASAKVSIVPLIQRP